MKKQTKKYISSDEQDESQINKFKMGDLKSFIFLMDYAKSYKNQFAGSILLIFISSAIAIYSAKLMGPLVEEGLMKKDFSRSMYFGLLILVLESFVVFFQWMGKRFLSKYASLTILKIREGMFHHLQELPMTYFDRQPQGRVVTRLTHDVEGLEDFFVNSLGKLLQAFFMVSMAAFAILSTDLSLGALIVASMIPAIFFIFLTKGHVRSLHRKMSKCSSTLNAKLSEYVDGIEVIRAFGLEKWTFNVYRKHIREQLNVMLTANVFYAWSRPFVNFLVYSPFFVLLWVGGKSVLAWALGVGVFISIMRYCERFFSPIMILSREIQVIQQAFSGAERVAGFLKQEDENQVLGENGKIRIPIKGNLSFKNVSMSYDRGDSLVLNNVTFNIQSGEKIGVVGKTGSGKSTTVSLISRLYDFQKGDIFLDGRSIRDFDRNYLRENIGFVSQDVFIFKGTLRDNLLLGSGEGISLIQDEQLIKAAKITGFENIMTSCELNLDSPITEGGGNLSSGEKQLLSLTRILIRNPKLLILDEATANIDEKYEDIIHEAVTRIMDGRTCLIVAHRLGTLKFCDRVMVFNLGEMVEEGSLDELLEQKGFYYNLQNRSTTEISTYSL